MTEVEKVVTEVDGTLKDIDDKAMHKSWCYTFFFEDDSDIEWLKTLDFKRHVASVETAPTTGRQHVQGEFTANRAYRFGQLKKICEKWRIVPAKCVTDSNYCRKHKSLLIINKDDRCQGKRSDLEEAREVLQKTQKMRDLVDQVPNSQAIRAAELYLRYKETPRPVAPIEVHWYWGRPGTGKTRKVFEMEPDVYRPVSYKWWEGYDGHEAVLIDDFRPDWCTFVQLLGLSDIYPFRVECKGGSRQARYTRLYITSCLSPWAAFEKLDENRNQLLRRLTLCYYFEEGQEPRDCEDLITKMLT